jgi:hypothetical protein
MTLVSLPLPRRDQEVEGAVRVVALGCHRQSLLNQLLDVGRPLTDAEDHELGRLLGATPTRQIMRPLSRSFWVMVVRSQRTK